VLRLWLLIAGLTVLLVACTSGDESASVSIPDGAVPVGTEAVSTEALAAVADLRPGDELYRLPVGDDRGVLIRVRGEEPPLLFGTSCDVVSAAPLPVGWQGTCLGIHMASSTHSRAVPPRHNQRESSGDRYRVH
jgi:hypothetical protein